MYLKETLLSTVCLDRGGRWLGGGASYLMEPIERLEKDTRLNMEQLRPEEPAFACGRAVSCCAMLPRNNGTIR